MTSKSVSIVLNSSSFDGIGVSPRATNFSCTLSTCSVSSNSTISLSSTSEPQSLDSFMVEIVSKHEEDEPELFLDLEPVRSSDPFPVDMEEGAGE